MVKLSSLLQTEKRPPQIICAMRNSSRRFFRRIFLYQVLFVKDTSTVDDQLDELYSGWFETNAFEVGHEITYDVQAS